MNLLVTNTRNAQAYGIVRALRPYARKIVATMEGDKRLAARLSHAANSRLVDKRYYTPSPVADWRAGRMQKENTEREEAYIQAVLGICDRENIDTIFPSFDPHVYVFSKNKERFERLGVLIPIPDYETVITPLDKYRTVLAAQEAGFPCPRTYLPESEDDLRRIAKELGLPVVLKPRFTAGGRGMEIVSDFSELSEKTRRLRKRQGTPMIQEYIPGKEKQVFYLTLDRKGELKLAFYRKTHRYFNRVQCSVPTAVESAMPSPHVRHAVTLVQKLSWWGWTTVETKVDPRDGISKFMEMNPRIGSNLWYMTELGINEPLMCLEIAKGEEVEPVKDYPLGTMLLSPIEDMLGLCFRLVDLLFYRSRVGILRKTPVSSLNPPMALSELFQSYRRTYFNGKKRVFNPYFRYFFQDPLVSFLWWGQYLTLVLRAAKELGR